MTTATAPRAFKNDAELAQLLSLVKGSDSVELKLTVPESAQRSAIDALGLDALDAQIRQVFFFDTPDLALNEHGVVVRARRVQGKGDDTVVKLRPVLPADLPDELRRLAAFRVEVDALPGGFVCSGTLKGIPPGSDVRTTLREGLPISALFTKQQQSYYAAHAPRRLSLDKLTPLGPIFVLKLRFTPSDFRRKLVAEMWLYPDGTRVLELSTRCTPGEPFQVAAETRAFLANHGVDLSGEQQTKTKKALEYFAGHATAAGRAATGDATVAGRATPRRGRGA
jgi:hypothetical protein